MRIEKQQIGILLATVCVVAGFVLLSYLPLARDNSRLKEARAQRQGQVLEADRQRDELPLMDKQIAELSLETINFGSQIPSGRGFSSLFEQIGDLMNAGMPSRKKFKKRKSSASTGSGSSD